MAHWKIIYTKEGSSRKTKKLKKGIKDVENK